MSCAVQRKQWKLTCECVFCIWVQLHTLLKVKYIAIEITKVVLHHSALEHMSEIYWLTVCCMHNSSANVQHSITHGKMIRAGPLLYASVLAIVMTTFFWIVTHVTFTPTLEKWPFSCFSTGDKGDVIRSTRAVKMGSHCRVIDCQWQYHKCTIVMYFSKTVFI